MLEFKDIGIEDKALFDQYTQCHGYHNLEACFGNVFLWRQAWHIRIATDELAMYLLMDKGEYPAFMIPPFLIDCDSNIGEPIRRCEAYMKAEYGSPLYFKGVTTQFKETIERDCPGEFAFTQDRANYEYVYLSDDLVNLVGKKYHSKRNHINKLLKNHTFEYRRNNGEFDAQCIALQKKWIEDKGGMSSDYADELFVTQQAFEYAEALGIVCGLLFVGGALEAFSLGQQHGEDMAVIHIEKADPNLQGSFPLINREFVRSEWTHLKYINREEDMGIEGLRRAKMSYNPAFLLEKYDCVRAKP